MLDSIFMRHLPVLALLLLGSPVLVRAAGPPPAQRAAFFEIEARENRNDGCTSCVCRVQSRLEEGARGEWWVAFGIVKPSGRDGAWDAVATSTYCGEGRFQEVSNDFLATVGVPYVTADLTLEADGPVSGGPNWNASIAVRTLSGLDPAGRPAYAQRKDTRALALAGDGALAVPLLLAGDAEEESFLVHELMLQARGSRLDASPRTYGTLSVTTDIPGARLLLDGGFVGRTTEGGPTILENVPTGDRDLLAGDFSGREARRAVRVREGRITEVSLPVLNLPVGARDEGLHPVGPNPQGYEEYWRSRDGAFVVRIPAGEFLMGSPDGRGEPNERPQHRVQVPEFLIDKTEVTWRQLRKFHEATGDPLPPAPISGTPDHYPASRILWGEAAAYCAWVGGRLPTEAEWEKAARGTEGREYPWGDRFEADRCNSISGGLHQVEDVGSYPDCLSPYGVLDLAGGMWEWCADWYAEDYYARSPAANPQGPDTGTQRIKRGGAWMSQPTWVRAAYRAWGSPTSRNVDHGFRCAQEAPVH